MVPNSSTGAEVHTNNEDYDNYDSTMPVSMRNVSCTGSEERLVDCVHASDQRCDHRTDVSVTCNVIGEPPSLVSSCEILTGFVWRSTPAFQP